MSNESKQMSLRVSLVAALKGGHLNTEGPRLGIQPESRISAPGIIDA